MRKKVLSLVFVFCLSLSIYAQETKEIFNNGQVAVEMNIAECNLYNRANPHDFVLLKYTNLSNEDVKFHFAVDLWYNDKKMDRPIGDNNKTGTFVLTFEPNEVIEASCENREDFLKVLYKHGNPKMDTQLTDIKIEEQKR